MKSSIVILSGIVGGFIVIGAVFAFNTPSVMKDASQFEYGKLCVTQFWTETQEKPNHLYVKSVIHEQLKQRIEFDIPEDQITIYDEGSEFVVSIPGEHKGRGSLRIVMIDILENIDGIIRVKEIAIACA